MKLAHLEDLFVEELKDLYSAETQLLPKPNRRQTARRPPESEACAARAKPDGAAPLPRAGVALALCARGACSPSV